jgi:hypothetical protein
MLIQSHGFDVLALAVLVVGIVWGPIIAAAVGGGLNAFGGNQQAKTSKEIAKMTDKRERELARADMAAREAQLNPFRNTNAQLGSAVALDRVARGSYTQPKVTIPGLRPEFMPQWSGGYSYEKSDELKGAATAARDAVLGGQGQAPTMTNPANYGQTGVMDLLAMLRRAGILPPQEGTGEGSIRPAVMPRTPGDYQPLA